MEAQAQNIDMKVFREYLHIPGDPTQSLWFYLRIPKYQHAPFSLAFSLSSFLFTPAAPSILLAIANQVEKLKQRRFAPPQVN